MTMTNRPEFGDDDPRDVWDDDDDRETRRANLKRIIEKIMTSDDYELKEWVSRKREELDGE